MRIPARSADNSINHAQPFRITKSYRPEKPYVYTEEELEKFAENFRRNIRTDGENLRYDPIGDMYFYPHKDELPQNSSGTESIQEHEDNHNRFCPII